MAITGATKPLATRPPASLWGPRTWLGGMTRPGPTSPPCMEALTNGLVLHPGPVLAILLPGQGATLPTTLRVRPKVFLQHPPNTAAQQTHTHPPARPLTVTPCLAAPFPSSSVLYLGT